MIRGIRGAITTNSNTAEDILSSAEKLLSEIVRQNALKINDIASIVFTLSPDLNAAFPAEAARKMGWNFVPLLCAKEIDVPDSLKKCIRVLLHVNTKKTPNEINHIYLEGAKVLREEFSG